jgi:hypothetical protein
MAHKYSASAAVNLPVQLDENYPEVTLWKFLQGSDSSFWATVYPLFKRRDLTREHLRSLVKIALMASNGDYRRAADLLHVGEDKYQKFLAFLNKFQCKVDQRVVQAWCT